jgi:hypothetical protein
MEIKINLDYDQILNLIHQLPDKDIEKLVDTLQSEVTSKKSPGSIKDLIHQAPTWTDSELNEFQAARDHIGSSLK